MKICQKISNLELKSLKAYQRNIDETYSVNPLLQLRPITIESIAHFPINKSHEFIINL